MSTLLVTERQEQLARDLVEKTPRSSTLSAHAPGRKNVTLPAPLTELLRNVLEAVASGGSVTIRALPAELSTTVAADLLGLSRPTLVKMIKAGEIRAHMVGSHRRLKLSDVLDFQRERLEQQRIAFDKLRELERTIEE